jgi:hypothetical protein
MYHERYYAETKNEKQCMYKIDRIQTAPQLGRRKILSYKPHPNGEAIQKYTQKRNKQNNYTCNMYKRHRDGKLQERSKHVQRMKPHPDGKSNESTLVKHTTERIKTQIKYKKKLPQMGREAISCRQTCSITF